MTINGVKDSNNEKIDETIYNIKMKQTSKLTEWEKLHPNYAQDPKLLNEWQQILNSMTEDVTQRDKVKDKLKRNMAEHVQLKQALTDAKKLIFWYISKINNNRYLFYMEDISNNSVQMKIIDKSLELLDISNIPQNVKKRNYVISPTAMSKLLKTDTLDPIDMSDDELEENCKLTGSYHKISYTKVRDSIDTLYYDECEYYSSAMDILASYVRGQKLIYMESKYYRNQQLNYLMLPAIFLSSLATVSSRCR